AILLCYLALLDPGDEVLLPDPFFPPYRDLAVVVGAQPRLIDTAPSFQLTAEMLKPHITAKTKILVINSPNNPTGAVYDKSELAKIANLAKKHRFFIISDEIYEHFVYDGEHFSVGSVYENVLTLNGFSKAYAMTGWRIGYVCGPGEVIDAINELQQYIVFSSSSIGQYAALAALRRSPAKAAQRYHAKRDLALKILADTFGDIHGGQGAFYLFLKLPGGIDDLGFINHLSHRGVLALPGSAFSKHHDYIRVSYGGETKNLKKGLERVRETVQIMKAGKHKL
ncbi:MAG TPA: aminotransferase class I/II-fold pyridoxal phosphate-dependent enzyme, partial [Candidatus Saccharimonadales bacterium]|nr:aminotransferase class I/II-fold pyridoxal phosphate-dependent enzyme [Candidatus Saccharimonadales bacterium]